MRFSLWGLGFVSVWGLGFGLAKRDLDGHGGQGGLREPALRDALREQACARRPRCADRRSACARCMRKVAVRVLHVSECVSLSISHILYEIGASIAGCEAAAHWRLRSRLSSGCADARMYRMHW